MTHKKKNTLLLTKMPEKKKAAFISDLLSAKTVEESIGILKKYQRRPQDTQ